MRSLLSEEDASCFSWVRQLYRNTLTTDFTQAFQNYHNNIWMLWRRSVHWLVPSHSAKSHDFFDAHGGIYLVNVFHFFLSDKKGILLKYAHTFLIFFFYAHLGVSIQDFFYAIFQNAHKNRWMETQLVIALKYETKMFQKFITCLSDNSYISYMGLCICFIFSKALLDSSVFCHSYANIWFKKTVSLLFNYFLSWF